MHRVVILYSFLPRLMVSMLAGSALALSGALFQHVLQNPLAEPTTLGVAAGASVAVTVAAIWFPSLLLSGRDVVAMCGAAAAFAIVFAIAWAHAFSPLVLILAGLVITLCAGAVGSVLSLIFSDGLINVFVWQSGALNQNGWAIFLHLLPRLALAFVATALLARPLAVLSVGEAGARGLGASLRWLRFGALLTGTTMAAWIVSALGVIGFIGLAGPTLAMLTGARTFGARLCWSPVIGALLLWVADQCVQAYATRFDEIPTGVATALLGAPLLLWLLPRLHDTLDSVVEDAHVPPRAAADPASRIVAMALLLTGTLANAFAFQAAKEALHHRVDAPMSSCTRRIGQISQNERVQFPDDIAFQAAVNFLVRHAFLGPTIDVGPGTWITAHPNHCNGP
jgi:ferric hydroxamate transport system permease protein